MARKTQYAAVEYFYGANIGQIFNSKESALKYLQERQAKQDGIDGDSLHSRRFRLFELGKEISLTKTVTTESVSRKVAKLSLKK